MKEEEEAGIIFCRHVPSVTSVTTVFGGCSGSIRIRHALVDNYVTLNSITELPSLTSVSISLSEELRLLEATQSSTEKLEVRPETGDNITY